MSSGHRANQHHHGCDVLVIGSSPIMLLEAVVRARADNDEAQSFNPNPVDLKATQAACGPRLEIVAYNNIAAGLSDRISAWREQGLWDVSRNNA